MKKYFLITLFLLVGTVGLSQYYLKNTIKQAIKAISDEKTNTNLEQQLVGDHIVLVWRNETSSCSMMLVFDNKDIGETYYIIPDNIEKQVLLNNYFTKQYKKYEPGHWTFFAFDLDRGIDIKFSMMEGGQSQFVFTIMPGIND